jgi:hypothetical protein
MDEHLVEERLRQYIRAQIKEELQFTPTGLLSENMYPLMVDRQSFKKVFVDPWKLWLKGAVIEAKKIASSVVLTARLLLTFNAKRAQEMIARHKDRMKEFKKQSDEIYQALGGSETDTLDDFLLLANPGAWFTKKMLSTTASTAKGTWEFAKEIGLSDKSIATFKGDESEEDALQRRRTTDRGPVRKALDALEQIFLLAGHNKSGNILSEAAEAEVADQVNAEIMAGPLGSTLEDTRNALAETASEFAALVERIAAQNTFLASIGSPDILRGLVDMRSSVNTLGKSNPEVAKELNVLLDTIEADARRLAADPEFRKGMENPEDEQAEKITDDIIYEKALAAVTGQVFESQYQEFLELITENRELLTTTFEDMFPEGSLTDEAVNAMDSIVPGFKKSIRLAERVLEKELRS